MNKRGSIGKCGVIALLSVGLANALNGAEPTGRQTLDNLQTAYNGESNAKARYEAFAAKAEAEGYKSVAALFRAAARSERIHAVKHAAAIEKLGATPKLTLETPDVKTTRENLEAAIKGETAEKDTMYPSFIKQAEAEQNKGAAMSFMGAMAAEKEHARLYTEALNDLDGWKAAGKEFLVCQVCGFTSMDMALKKCPVCDSPRTKFELVR